ncbi:hypothetical protein EJV47_18045 [Hymenobacter gummosus]|uniref:YdhG-like domain-containing protein n=1 Tax=Hymenobacter gummosus TaxID=1776032 RepID=A0A3S0QGG9_9BACT|nr:YdeI family protein [Hymenobacter gummosus]RTQ47821.1 hypothetical protein EJV47_18045 [Hymenobacter gummosus]
MNPQVDAYLAQGCGRCPLGGTPDCTVLKWQPGLQALRRLVLDCGLTEELKWGVPCYTFQGQNVVLIHAFKDYCALNFFKGALLSDEHGLLTQQTANVQGGRQIRFTSAAQIAALEPVLKAYLFEAIEVEKAGLKVAYKPTTEFAMPEELRQKLQETPALQAAFQALTPGRQRGYLLYFAAAKQAKTRTARIEKYAPLILAGKGLHD